jgi:acyl-CoA reductase-like NAD-dependent aldehyde dehydrogenase
MMDADRLLSRLVERQPAWAALAARDRAVLLRRCADGIAGVSADWVRAGCAAKGIDPGTALAGEEWLAGPMTSTRGIRLMAETLERLPHPVPVPVATRPNGQHVATVFPRGTFDRMLYLGLRGDLWIQPGKPASRARVYRGDVDGTDHSRGGCTLVLGAGNVSSIGPLDVLTMLVVENRVALLKLNPVNEYLEPIFAKAFAPLIDEGFMGIVRGGAEVGAALCHHTLVDRVHLTGSRRTFDAIVWGGTAEERELRRRTQDPLLRKPVTAELGCVTPIIVVPGPWSDDDLEFHARHVAGMVANNASFNCVAGKVLVLSSRWPQRGAFLARVSAALARTPARRAYYPGAFDRYGEFLRRYSGAEVLGPAGDGVVPWTLIPDVPPVKGEFALSEEAFCGVIATVQLDAADADEFLAKAVPFVNGSIEGTLSCVMLVHPETRREHAAAVDRAIADLRYGGIGINVWSAVLFAIGVTSWGAFPGHTPADVGSGIGVVHNCLMFDYPEKSVVKAPFRMWPTPVWFPDHRNLAEVGRQMAAFERMPSWSKLPGVLSAALRA